MFCNTINLEKPLEQQFSINSMSAPPEYDQVNRQLQPDIAPLPKVKVRSEKPKEGEKYWFDTENMMYPSLFPRWIGSECSYKMHSLN